MSWRRAAPWLWLLFVLGVALHQWRFWHEDRLETDLFALLPADERAPGSERALRGLTDAASRQVVVVVGAPEWPQARRAAERLAVEWRALDPGLDAAPGFDASTAEQAVLALRPWRDRLLDPEQVELLRHAPTDALAAQALAALHQPGLAWRLSDWAADPLGLWPRWWARRAANNPLRPREGWLALQANGRHWIVLARQTRGTAFSMGGERPHGRALDAIEKILRTAEPEVEVLRAGVPLHAEAAAAQGAAEINLIGWGSLAAVLALVWAGFRSLRPMACVALSLAVGVAVALSVTAWAFGRVHLVTLVFGASLVGVAEDFGIHYFASRAAAPQEPGPALMRRLWPGMALALATSVLGYAVMALVPFPGLRQMALFSAVGLVAAFATVACWFPFLAGPSRGMTPLASRIAQTLGWLHWRPSLPKRAAGWGLWALLAALLALGLVKMPVRDDLRQLQSSPPALQQQQRQVQQLLRWPSPGQFFMVHAASEDEVLQSEQRLLAALAPLRAQGLISGWSALSDWVPPLERQREAAMLTARAEAAVLASLGRQLGERFERPAPATAALDLTGWLAQPAAGALRAQWLGRQADGGVASVVLISGLERPDDLPRIARAAEGLPGVRWVDRVAEMSQLLARYRAAMSFVLVAGFLLVGAALWARYRRDAWRAWLPSALACAISLGALGWLGLPLQLFNVLALIILLGIGVDYGIFLLEHRGDGSAWLAVVLGAASTLLSFGLLGLSSTPALRAFGLTMALGVSAVVLLSPMFLPRERPPPEAPSALPPQGGAAGGPAKPDPRQPLGGGGFMRRRRTLLALLPQGYLAGCATPAPAPPTLLLRLPPAALGRRLALAQQLRIWAGDREFQFEALLEADEASLRLALLSFAQPVARLQWDGSALTQHTAPGWPAAVSAERVLSDLVLVLWPAAAVAAALPPDWSLQHDGSSRELRWRGSVVQRVRYEDPQRLRLEHLVLGYRMQIDSQSINPHATAP